MSHIELKIMKGIAPAVGDSNSNESQPEVIDLLAGMHGFSVDTYGWIPQLPVPRSNFIESGLSDGAQLLAGGVGLITETLTLTASAATLQGRYYLERELHRLARSARDFHTTDWQIEPVYLKWFAKSGTGPQYALIYTIEVAQQDEPFIEGVPQRMVVTLTREPYWRALPPGVNPKLYTFEKRGWVPGKDYSTSNLPLYQDTDHFAVDDLDNRNEWNANNYRDRWSRNFLTIPKEDIPGDAPALVEISIISGALTAGTPGDTYYNRVFIGRSTKPVELNTSNVGRKGVSYILNAGDASFASKASGLGLISNGSNVTKYHAETSGGAPSVIWFDNGVSDAERTLDLNGLRGRFAVFVRCVQTTSNVNQDFEMSIDFGEQAFRETGVADWQTVLSTPTVLSSADNDLQIVYFGEVNFPLSGGHSVSSPAGYGLQRVDGIEGSITGEEQANLRIDLNATYIGGSANNLDIYDLILIPIDEAAIVLQGITPPTDNPQLFYIYDSTGYLAHGQPGESARQYVYASGYTPNSGVVIEQTGPVLTLLPGRDNHLHMLVEEISDADGVTCIPSSEFSVRVNIVPRWSGVRDDTLTRPTETGNRILTDDDGVPLTDDAGNILTEG